MQSYHVIVNCVPTPYITHWHLFCNWRFMPLDLHHLFLSAHPLPLLLWQPPVLCIMTLLLLCCVHVFCFSDSTCKWNYIVFVFSVWLISLSIITFRFIHVITSGNISFVCVYVYICVYIYIYIYIYNIFIYQWAFGLLPYLGCCKYCRSEQRGVYIFLS